MSYYIIEYRGTHYATTANSQMDAECKFIEEVVDMYSDEDFKIKEISEEGLDSKNVEWF